MDNKKAKKIGNQVSLLLCLLVLGYYSLKTYESIPTDAQSRFHSWYQSNEEALLEQAAQTSIRFHFKVTTDDHSNEWTVERSPDDEEHNKRLVRLLELAEANQIFLFEDSQSANCSVVTLAIGDDHYSASLSRERIEHNPALQTFLRLSKIYALEQPEIDSMKEIQNARS